MTSLNHPKTKQLMMQSSSSAFVSSFIPKCATRGSNDRIGIPVCTLKCNHDVKHMRNSNIVINSRKEEGSSSRRTFLLNATFLTTAFLVGKNPKSVNAQDVDVDYSTYKGPVSLGYSFSYPSSWSVKKKPIKTHLSEIIVTDNTDSSSSAGLVVDAIKIESIDKFGTPDDVGEKVIAVESKKESVKEAHVTAARSESKNGLIYYIIDYTVNSTRGIKRYVAKATVSDGQLYVFTTQAKVDNYIGITEKKFEQMLSSFNVVKQYL